MVENMSCGFWHRENFREVFVFSVVFILSFSCFGQNRLTYEGKMTLMSGEAPGKASYQYYLDRNDTIKDGSFEYSSTRPDTGEFDFLKSITYEGNYTGDIKTGDWVYRVKYFTPENKPKIEGFEIKYPATGKENVIFANFKNGAAHGSWKFIEYEVEIGQPTDTVFLINSNFDKGRVSGNFEGLGVGIKTKGTFDEEGFIHGKWVFSHYNEEGVELPETREYNHGVLQGHSFEKDGNIFEIDLMGLDTEREEEDEIWEELVISEKYFNVLKNTRYGLKSMNGEAGGELEELINERSDTSNVFLKKALYCFGKHENIPVWHLTGGSDSINYARVKLRKFPYTEDEENGIEVTAKNLEKADQKIKDFFEDPQIDISRHSYEDVAFYFEVFKRYKPKLETLQSVVGRLKSPAFLFIDRYEVFPAMYRGGELRNTIEFEFDDQSRVKQHDYPIEIDFEKKYFEELERMSNDVLDDVEEINEALNKILEKYKKEKRLREKEEVLVQKRDTVLNLFSNDVESKKFNDFHREAAPRVKEFIEKTFKKYASYETEKRLSIADSLVSCFDELIEMFKVQTQIPEKLERLDDLYIRTVWNPYTMTDMDERVKERLYTVFEKDVLPVVLSSLNSDYNCNEIEENAITFNKLYSYMVAVREEDTRELERELRRAAGPEERREVFMNEVNKSN